MAEGRRKNVLNDEDYFMGVALLTSQRSKDPATQVGACVVSKDGKVMSTGYNGMPNGCPDDDMPWGKNKKNYLHDKHTYVCHAEMNALLNRYSKDYAGCTLYQTLNPCNECAKLIVCAKIEKIYWNTMKDKDKFEAGKKLLNEAGVKFEDFKTEQKEILIFEGDPPINRNANDKSKMRTNYLDWEDYYMSLAKLTALRSRDPSTQVGACIVDPDKRIVGLGYNDYPPGTQENWNKEGEELHQKYLYVGHAAANAVMYREKTDLSGSTLYTTLFPCNECVKILIQTGIKKIVFESDQYNKLEYRRRMPGARMMLEKVGVETIKRERQQKEKIVINYGIKQQVQQQLPQQEQPNERASKRSKRS